MDAEKIDVVLRNPNSTLTMDRFEVFDNICNAAVGTFTLKGGESRPISISPDADGKGRVKLRNLDDGACDWVEIVSVSAGDIISV
jgi:hypothetical protein